jgi:predicted AAA+ superfamily ATPase
MKTHDERAIWFDGYVRTYLERDLQDLASISALPDFRRLMRAASLRIGQLLNQTELGRDVALPQPTVHRWLNLLETSYQLVRFPADAVNRTKRLIKSPKLYWSDTGVAMHLAESTEAIGAHLENLVLHDLLVWRDARLDRAEICYWRTAAGEEVDLVIEAGDQLLPIEIKASARPKLADAVHLRSFQEEYGKRARTALLIHTGSTLEWLTPTVLAVPWGRLL